MEGDERESGMHEAGADQDEYYDDEEQYEGDFVQHGSQHAAAHEGGEYGDGEGGGGVDPEALAEITRTVQVEMAQQLKMITEEMNRLKSELYSEQGGLAEIQRSLETLKKSPIMEEGGGAPPARAAGGVAARSSGGGAPRQAAGQGRREEKGARGGMDDRAREEAMASYRQFLEERGGGREGRGDAFMEGLRARQGGGEAAGARAMREEGKGGGRAGGRERDRAADTAGLNWKLTLLIVIILMLGPFRGMLAEMYNIFMESYYPEEYEEYLIDVE